MSPYWLPVIGTVVGMGLVVLAHIIQVRMSKNTMREMALIRDAYRKGMESK